MSRGYKPLTPHVMLTLIQVKTKRAILAGIRDEVTEIVDGSSRSALDTGEFYPVILCHRN